MVASIKLLYLSFGRAGKECLELLLKTGYCLDNILIYTYDLKDNKPYLDFLKENKINYSLAKIKDSNQFEKIKSFKPDAVISMHFRDLIPAKIIEIASFGGLNLHPSLLPRYAGCMATMWAIINGETKTGITYHYLTSTFDTGKILIQKEIEILATETGESLFNKAIDVGVKEFIGVLNKLLDKNSGQEQVGERSYYSRDLPFSGLIDHTWKQERIDRFIRAFTFNDKPFADVVIGDKKIPVDSIETYQKLLDQK